MEVWFEGLLPLLFLKDPRTLGCGATSCVNIFVCYILQLPLSTDVDLDAIARMTEGFSGADLQALLSDAQLAAVHDVLSSAESNKPAKTPVITDLLLKSIASKARSSVSEAEKKRLYAIYSQFLDSKKSAATQVFFYPCSMHSCRHREFFIQFAP